MTASETGSQLRRNSESLLDSDRHSESGVSRLDDDRQSNFSFSSHARSKTDKSEQHGSDSDSTIEPEDDHESKALSESGRSRTTSKAASISGRSRQDDEVSVSGASEVETGSISGVSTGQSSSKFRDDRSESGTSRHDDAKSESGHSNFDDLLSEHSRSKQRRVSTASGSVSGMSVGKSSAAGSKIVDDDGSSVSGLSEHDSYVKSRSQSITSADLQNDAKLLDESDKGSVYKVFKTILHY